MNNLYIDIDDVIAATSKKIPELVRDHFNINASYNDMQTFDLKEAFKLNQTQYDTLMKLLHKKSIIQNFEPVEYASETINNLKNLGFTIILITGRQPDVYHSTVSWLKQHQFEYQNLFFLDKYGRFNGDENHPFVLSHSDFSDLKFRFAVEDSFEMAVRLAESGTDVALFNRPWNSGKDTIRFTSGTIQRCYTWKDVHALITKKAVIN